MKLEDLFNRRIEATLAAIEAVRLRRAELASAAELIINCLRAGGTIYTAGNGGSAAQALHLAEELIGRYRSNRRPLRAICLNADATALTCIANDFGFEAVFARQCEALLRHGDVLVVLSTSGNSPNILKALEVAQTRGCHSIGLLGGRGGAAMAACTTGICVSPPAADNVLDSASVQDAHQVALHLLCEAVERAFAGPE